MSLSFSCWPEGTGFSYSVDAPAGTEFNIRVVASGSGGHQISKELSGTITNGNGQYYEPVFFMVMNVGIAEIRFDMPGGEASVATSNGDESRARRTQSPGGDVHGVGALSPRNELSAAPSFNDYPYPAPHDELSAASSLDDYPYPFSLH